MCGRFVIADDKEIAEIKAILAEINKKYNGTGVSAKTGEIFPTDNVPVLALSGVKPELSLMKWGFPRYGSKSVIINARAETAGEKGMFSKHLKERRCVIPSTGFFEWRHNGGKATKDKFQFNTPDGPMLYMAGVFSTAADTGPGNPRERFVIVTRAANNSISDIHDRMPVILYKNELTRWLRDEKFIPYAFGRDDVRLEKSAV